LHKQATKERSHFYVGSLCEEAIEEIVSLRTILSAINTLTLKARRAKDDIHNKREGNHQEGDRQGSRQGKDGGECEGISQD
tara:strand:- start:2115 stop:2357 length:243 start_codon:yes stop_codon:yes gene_type:complete